MLHRNDCIITEGMRAGDLSDLILPLVSVDEFESKIDEDAIVIGFFITDKDAADDLNRFIQRSPVEILDSDISPAPDQNGHYMVFIELLNNKQASENILALVEEVSALCGIERWDAQIRGRNEMQELKSDTLSEALQANKQHDAAARGEGRLKTTKESIETALRESDLPDLVVLDKDGQAVVFAELYPLSEMKRFLVLSVGKGTQVVNESSDAVGVDLSFDGVAAANQVQRALGANWDVETVGDLQTWRRNDDLCLIVRPI